MAAAHRAPGPVAVQPVSDRLDALRWRVRGPGRQPGPTVPGQAWDLRPWHSTRRACTVRSCGPTPRTGRSHGHHVTVSEDRGAPRPGPRRPDGAPSGPEQVRRALLDAAATLFAERGVDRVSLRDIAAAADVHLSLIKRYIGTREELVLAVFEDLSEQLSAEVLAHPLEMQGYDIDTVMGKWVRIASALAGSGRSLTNADGFNPVLAMAETLGRRSGCRQDIVPPVEMGFRHDIVPLSGACGRG